MPSYVVTGANRGIGFEFVRQLSAKPENVVIALVRNLGAIEGLQNLKRSNVHILKADIVDVPALKAAAAETAKIMGGSLDMLINNAALMIADKVRFTLDGYPEDLLEADMLEFFRVNTIGVIHTINAFLPLIKKGSLKKFAVLSTGVGDLEFTLSAGYAINCPYGVSKAAVNLAVAKYAAEYKSERIAFLAVSPGLVNTAPTSPNPETRALIERETKNLKKLSPGWEGPLTPEQSVTKVLKVIDDLAIEDSGAFLSHNGNRMWL